MSKIASKLFHISNNGYAGLKEVWLRNSNCKLQIYKAYNYLQICLCARF